MTDEPRSAAQHLREQARSVEPGLTTELLELVEPLDGWLEGLAHRFKSEDSLVRKLETRLATGRAATLAEAIEQISDVLRFTMCFPLARYVAALEAALDRLTDERHTLVSLESSWPRGDMYSGVHAVVRRQGLPVEIQVHTSDSYARKSAQHHDYSEFRSLDVPDARRAVLYDDMADNWDDLPVPDGVDDVIARFGGEEVFYPDPWDVVERAEELAEEAHAGQVDKAGLPYIEHARRVVDAVAAAGADAEVVAAAWLHDVIEDTPLTAVDLAASGMPLRTIHAVQALTRRRDEHDEAYIRRVAAVPDALEVKRADTADNRDPERLAALPDDLASRLAAKYDGYDRILASLE